MEKFCPLTKENCREDCALKITYTIDAKGTEKTACSFAATGEALDIKLEAIFNAIHDTRS